MKQVFAEMGLVRNDLIVMALFMGSDYTPGVKGIAAVNAIEIINSFGSTEDDLKKFHKWVNIETQIKD
jgi:DNA excision repair protein ERCC-5